MSIRKDTVRRIGIYGIRESQRRIAESAHAMHLQSNLPRRPEQRICLVANDGHLSIFENIVGVRPSPWPHFLSYSGATVSGYALPILLQREAGAGGKT